MKILIFITCLHPHGAEYACLRHMKIIQKKYNCKFLVISITGGELYEKFIKEGIETHILKDIKNPLKKLNFIYQKIAFFEPDIIHSWMYHANFISHLISIFFNLPLITSIRQSLPFYKVLRKKTLIIALLDSLLSNLRSCRIIFNSYKGMKDHQRKLFYPEKKCQLIYNDPYLLSVEEQEKIKENNYSKNKKIKIISLARNDPSKNFEYLFLLLSKLNLEDCTLELSIFGEGVSKINSKNMDFLKKNNIIFSLNEAVKDLKTILTDSDIYISTSLWEGYPNSLITAASAGCIIACTDAGDSWKILNNQCYRLNLSIKEDIEKINFAIAEAKVNNRYKRILKFNNYISKLKPGSHLFYNLYLSILKS